MDPLCRPFSNFQSRVNDLGREGGEERVNILENACSTICDLYWGIVKIMREGETRYLFTYLGRRVSSSRISKGSQRMSMKMRVT